MKTNKIYLYFTLIVSVFLFFSCSREDPNAGMVLISEGEFIMGAAAKDPDKAPKEKISLAAFYMDKFEVTNEQYKEFIVKTSHRETRDWAINGYNKDKRKHPVVFVSFEDALAYCKSLGKRLPTEEEWEKAARGTNGLTYPWSNKFEDNKANTNLSGIVGTMEVGAYSDGKSPYGLYDMAGNVWEWTSSEYNKEDGTKAVKSGSWGLSHRFARTFTRVGYSPKTRINNLGFRCSRGETEQK